MIPWIVLPTMSGYPELLHNFKNLMQLAGQFRTTPKSSGCSLGFEARMTLHMPAKISHVSYFPLILSSGGSGVIPTIFSNPRSAF